MKQLITNTQIKSFKMANDDLNSDDDLILRLMDKDESAIIDLQKKYGAVLMAILKRSFSSLSHEDIEEIYNDTIRKVWYNIEKYDERQNIFAAWLFRIARNIALDYLKSSGFNNAQNEQTKSEEFWSIIQEINPGTECVKQQIDEKGTSELKIVQEVVMKLNPLQQEICKYIANFYPGKINDKTIAKWLGETEGNIRVQRFRALAKIKEKLQDNKIFFAIKNREEGIKNGKQISGP